MASLKPRNFESKIILSQLTKDLFLKNIDDARKAQGVHLEHYDFNKSRCKVLSKTETVKNNSSGILYWMMRDCRVQDNWAMIFAQRLAMKQNLPLYVCYLYKDAHKICPTVRHLTFLIEGLKFVEKECKDLNIGFYVLNSSVEDLAAVIEKNNIGGVVCDFYPLKHPTELQKRLMNKLDKNVPVVQIDAHNIVPTWIASDKQEGMAKFLRSKINKNLPEYLCGFPKVSKHKYSGTLKYLTNCFKDLDEAAYKCFNPKWDVGVVKWGEGPGEEGGLSMLRIFMVERLMYYGVNSNDPSKDNTSKLSPWLRFGQISAQRCALEIKSLESLYKEQCEKYLEELIVRRELTDNYCYYNQNYDNINGAASWAKETLKLHSKDKRTWTYTREQLENAQTHDEMWNAAQIQASTEGKINGYMRMYWAKKILEWTESPEQALEYALWLNDTFCLDGTDPNGYVGVMWSICGVHDQGWRERDIFGKIRYMVDYSLRRKFDMETYCARYGIKMNVDKKKAKAAPKRGIKRKAV
nr:unnamed protein product [Callosobruchus analis]